MNHRALHYSVTLDPSSQEDKTNLFQRLKKSMIAESTLIASNLKVFLGCIAVVVVGVAEIAAGPTSVEEYTVKGMLIVAVIVLVRQIQVDRKEHRAEVTKLWEKIERLLKKNGIEDDDERPPTHRSRP